LPGSHRRSRLRAGELVSFSAFMGGIGIPAIVLLRLGLIPYLDREDEGTGEWFGGPGGCFNA